MKRGYHSSQDKVLSSIPRSEFIGIALGFAFGMIVHGVLKQDSNTGEIVGAAVGFFIGYFIDRRFYLEEDSPVAELDKNAGERIDKNNEIGMDDG